MDHDYDSMVSKTLQKSGGTFVIQSAVTQSQGFSRVSTGTSFPSRCLCRCLFHWQVKQPCTYSHTDFDIMLLQTSGSFYPLCISQSDA